jgi:CCR4-NOT transcriptional regulation complex NOT5 subunit
VFITLHGKTLSIINDEAIYDNRNINVSFEPKILSNFSCVGKESESSQNVSQSSIQDVSKSHMQDNSQSSIQDVAKSPMQDDSQSSIQDVSKSPVQEGLNTNNSLNISKRKTFDEPTVNALNWKKLEIPDASDEGNFIYKKTSNKKRTLEGENTADTKNEFETKYIETQLIGECADSIEDCFKSSSHIPAYQHG